MPYQRFLSWLLVMMLTLASLCVRGAWAEDKGSDDDEHHWNPNKNVKPPRQHHDFVNANTWEFEAVNGSNASGQITLTCFSDDKDTVLIKLHHVPAHGIFTAWVATSLKDDADVAGIGDKPHSFKSGGDSVTWGRPTDDCPLTKYKWFIIRQHPDGDPTHLDKSVVILKARLRGQ